MTQDTMTTEPLVYNPHDPETIKDPYPVYSRMRAEDPVHYWETAHCWVLTRYDDVVSLLKDSRFTTDIRTWKFYQEQKDTTPEEVRRYAEKGLFQLDHAGHARVRKLVSPVFTPRRAAAREPLIQEVIDELLDQAMADEDQVIDLVPALADPMPLRVIRRILNIPGEHDEAFRTWSLDTLRVVFPGMAPEEAAAAAQRIPAGYAMMRGIVERRRAALGDDLLSAMIQARDEEDRLDEEEMISLVSALVLAGSETTVHLLCRCVVNLIRHPEIQARVRADLELLPAFIEETLRNDNFGTGGVVRYALEDVELGGKTIAKGQMVSCVIAAAMHDESIFPEPERFDIERESIPNISFGRGPHFCLGAHLARAEVRVALRTLLTRFPVLEEAGEYRYTPHPIIRAISTLPVRLRPAP